MPAETESDREIVLDVTRSKKNKHLCHGDKMKIVKNKRTFEPISIDDKKSVYTMKIRCTCIQLENGNYEYLISNLPLKKFSALDLRELYWKRWSIETSFRRLKYALSLLHAFATEEKRKSKERKKGNMNTKNPLKMFFLLHEDS